MSVKNTLVIGGTVIVMAVGVNQALLPKDAKDYQDNRRQDQIQDLSDAHERETERMRAAGNSHLDAELDQQNVPGEPRPGEHPHIKIRLP